MPILGRREMRVCFNNKHDAVEYAQNLSIKNRYCSMIFPSSLDYATIQYCKEQLHNLETKGMVLYEPWSDFKPKLKSTTYAKRYKRAYEYTREIRKKKYPFNITEEQLRAMVMKLQKNYSRKG